MNKRRQIHAVPATLPEEIGGEDLSGSGFEDEVPAPDFIEPEPVSAGEER